MKIRRALSALLAVSVLAGSCITPLAVSADNDEPREILYGDFNQDEKIDVTDAVMIARFYVMDYDLVVTDQGKRQADVNQDGNIDDTDLIQVLEYIARKRTVLGYGEEKKVEYKAKNLMAGIEASVPASKNADEVFVDSQLKLTVDLLKGAAADEQSKDKDLLISPLSVSQAIAMATNGAKGETKTEMEKLLGDTLDIDALNQYYYDYTTKLTKADNAKLSLANSLWIKDDPDAIQVPESFLQTTRNYYGADAFMAPFDQTTVEDVNNWVNLNTHEMIPKVIEKMDPNWIMLLINALAFEAEWANPYYKEDVQETTFHAYDGDMKADMMYSHEYCYLHDDKASGFMKHYKGGDYSFAAILPDEGISVNEYIESMTADSLKKILNSKSNELVYTGLPKFKYDYSITMNDMLQALGMKLAFERGTADFKGLNTIEQTYIDLVVHKTFIQVDERGTKAGAVTMIAMAGNGVMPEPKYVYLDRPFIYMIVDNSTNLPVFIGYVLHPVAGK